MIAPAKLEEIRDLVHEAYAMAKSNSAAELLATAFGVLVAELQAAQPATDRALEVGCCASLAEATAKVEALEGEIREAVEMLALVDEAASKGESARAVMTRLLVGDPSLARLDLLGRARARRREAPRD